MCSPKATSKLRHLSTWMGSCFFTPLIGAFLADT
uniref:Uncharacterized protein n=1 Tax=Arundo donax TaxID=35708 RepID=A0A0A9CHP2_ARUDO